MIDSKKIYTERYVKQLKNRIEEFERDLRQISNNYGEDRLYYNEVAKENESLREKIEYYESEDYEAARIKAEKFDKLQENLMTLLEDKIRKIAREEVEDIIDSRGFYEYRGEDD